MAKKKGFQFNFVVGNHTDAVTHITKPIIRKAHNNQTSQVLERFHRCVARFMRDFDYAKVLKGRSNYPTLMTELFYNPAMRVTAADCNATPKKPCSWCGSRNRKDEFRCPYRKAKMEALNATLAVTNISYFINEANSPSGKFPATVGDNR